MLKAKSLPLIIHDEKNLFTLYKSQSGYCGTVTLGATQQAKIAAYANSNSERAEITQPWSVLILP